MPYNCNWVLLLLFLGVSAKPSISMSPEHDENKEKASPLCVNESLRDLILTVSSAPSF